MAVVAAIVISVLTVDLGPNLREIAEREGTKYMERPMRIGRLSAKLTPGVFVIEDLLIEGLTPTDRPFLKAKKIEVRVPWWTAISRKLVVESVTMTDWDMVVESWAGGRHSFPKVTPKNPRKGPSTFTTTLRYVLATRGQFTYDDHGTPWSTVARNLTLQLHRSEPTGDYRGRATITNGTVKIQAYQPFRMDMQSRFSLNGGKVHFDRMDLVSDGARTVATGDVDLGRWPEQLYQLKSRIDFPTQKEIFFHGQKFDVSGVGDFTGTFHLFKGGRELKGAFVSGLAGVNDWRFPNLRGSVLWVPDRLEITNATSEVYGGTARFDYRMAPFGQPTPARATWDVEYKGVDLVRLSDFLEIEGLRMAGRASGRNRLEWPLGKWALKTGEGEANVEAPPDVRPMTRELPADLVAELGALPDRGRAVQPASVARPRADRRPDRLLARPAVDSAQEELGGNEPNLRRVRRSDRVWRAVAHPVPREQPGLAGKRSRARRHHDRVRVADRGGADGRLRRVRRCCCSKRSSVRGSRVRCRASASAPGMSCGEPAAPTWQSRTATSSCRMPRLTAGDSQIRADGQFSLGFPRRDGGDEIDARVRVTRRPLADLRHAFSLDDYPIEGMVSGEYQLYGKYQTPFGFGRLNIEKGTAYGETFDSATSSLRFEGAGVRLDNIDIRKSTGGVTGAAYVGWDGNYSFNADGAAIPVESLVSVAFPRAPLSGRLQFNATGAGTFDEPRYDVKLAVDDLFAGDEGIGQLSGRLNLRGDLLTLDLEAASARLVVSGSGRIALTDEMDAELTVRFRETSLDPYVRFFEPRLSPYTTAIIGGTMRVVGELANPDQLVVDTKIEQLDLKLFDYRVRNDGPIELMLDQNVLDIGRFRLAGEGTQLQLDGRLGLKDQTLDVQATGDANLGILQAFFRTLRSRGTADLKAQLTGTFSQPVFSGSATITDGRLRHFSLPHSLEAINGRVSFDASGLRVDEVTGRLGGGSVTFGGRIGLDGFAHRGPQPDGNRRAHDGSLSRRVPFGHRRRPRPAGDDERARAQRDGRRAGWALVASHRDEPGSLQPGGGHRDHARVRPGLGDAAGALRRRDRRGVQPADPEQRRQHGGERGPEAAGHLRPAAPLRPRRDRTRRSAVRGQPLHHHAGREHRLLQPVADRAVLRPRGRDARAPAGAAVCADDRPERHDQPVQSHPELGSSAAGSGHHLAALRPERQPGGRRTAESAFERGAAVRDGTAARRLGEDAGQPDFGAGWPRARRGVRCRQRADHAVARQRDRHADAVGTRGHRQADLESRLPDVRARARHEQQRPRSGHRPRIRPERAAGLGVHPAWRQYLRPRLPGAPPILMRALLSRWARWAAVWGLVTGWAVPARAQSPASQYAGRPVEAIQLLVENRVTTDAAVLDLIAVRTGEALSIGAVRASIAHIYSLGRFQDVQVEAAEAPGGGVALRFNLIPIHSVQRIEFTGTLGLSAGLLRSTVVDRYGASPSIGRVDAAVRTLQQLYADHGYLRAKVEASSEVQHDPDRVQLTFTIDAGPRAVIGKVAIERDPLITREAFLRQLGAEPGATYLRPRIQERLDTYVQRLKDRRYYEAEGSLQPIASEDGRTVDLVIGITSGLPVTVRFDFQGGEALPADRLKELAPLEREGSVDEDLLEDSETRIENYLRQQGYWKADVTVRREATATALTIVFAVTRGLQYRIAAPTEITGAQGVPVAELAALVALKPGELFLETTLDAGVAAIAAHYRQRGFAAVEVRPGVNETDPPRAVEGAAPSPVQGYVRATIVIAEGSQSVLGEIRIMGTAAVAADELRHLVKVAPGDAYFEPRIVEARDALVLEYLNRGFASASVGVALSASADHTRVDLTFTVQEGPQSIVDHILIVGNAHTKPDVILRELQFKPGQPIGLQDQFESRRRLSALGLFRRVQITEIRHGTGSERDVLVTVEEAPATSIGYGGGVEAFTILRDGPDGQAEDQLEFAPRGFFDIGRRNLFGANRSVNLYTRVSLRPNAPDDSDAENSDFGFTEFRVVGTYRQPRWFGANDFIINAVVEQGVRTTFNFARRGVNVDVVRRLTPAVRVSGRYSLSSTRTFDEQLSDEDQATIDRLFPEVRLSGFSGAVARDTRDDLLDPTRGTFLSGEGSLAARALGGEVGFVKTYVQGFTFHRLPGRRPVVFASRAALGLANGFPREVQPIDADGNPIPGPPEVVDDLPASERFFAGGDTTIRGYALDSVGAPNTITSSGFPTGGNAVVLLNGELRVPVWRDIGAVLFVDGGNVFRRVNEFDFGELRGSYGFGLRYKSPVGPIRVDLGFKMDRRVVAGKLEPPTAIHFSLGQAF